MASLRSRSSGQLRRLGRLGHPMRRRRGEPGFRRIDWDEALGALAGAIGGADPERVAIYLTSRGLTNETYYVAGKAARAMGIAGIDSAARVCHAPSTVGLKETIGVAAATCSLHDVIESDLVVLWGTNPANNQPVFMKYLYLAKKRGAGSSWSTRTSSPASSGTGCRPTSSRRCSAPRSATCTCPVRPGGDVALANAVLKRLIGRDAVDDAFVEAHTEGWDELVAALDGRSEDDLLAQAGITAAQLDAFVDLYAGARSAVLIWSMGITQHRDAVDGVRAIVNLGLARGNVGRDGAGPHADPRPLRRAGRRRDGRVRDRASPAGQPSTPPMPPRCRRSGASPCRPRPGLTAPEMIDAAAAGELDVLWSSGGNFLDVLPDPPTVRGGAGAGAAAGPPGHGRVVPDARRRRRRASCCPWPPATSRRAAAPRPRPSGGSSSARRSRGGWARRGASGGSSPTWPPASDPTSLPPSPGPTTRPCAPRSPASCRPTPGSRPCATTGDQVQWGGRHLCADGVFPTPDGRGRFTPLQPNASTLPPGTFTVATRRGKQFNSMV